MTTSTDTTETMTWESLHAQTLAFGMHLRRGGTLAGQREITPRECEALYVTGLRDYELGQYSKAFRTFSLLVMHDHLEPRYLMALGGAAKMIGRQEDALTQYMAAAALLLDDPRPLLYSAQCLLELKRRDAAVETLELCLSLCVEDKHEEVATHARKLLNHLGHS